MTVHGRSELVMYREDGSRRATDLATDQRSDGKRPAFHIVYRSYAMDKKLEIARGMASVGLAITTRSCAWDGKRTEETETW